MDIHGYIDIGTTKISVLIAKKVGENFEILGKAIEAFNGLKKGIITDIEEASSVIKSCVQKAQSLSNTHINSVYVNYMDAHINIVESIESVDIERKGNEVSEKDVRLLINKLSQVGPEEGFEVIDMALDKVTLDGNDVSKPVGMRGEKLEIEADVVLGKSITVSSIIESINNANLKVKGFVFEAYAVGNAVLTNRERDSGAVIIDIGGEVTNVSVFKEGKLLFFQSLPVGGQHLTKDISIGLEVPFTEAEKLKKEYNIAMSSLVKNDMEIYAGRNGDGQDRIKVSQLVEIMEARIQEIYLLCKEMLKKYGVFSNFDGGIVLTGGGISFLDGASELADSVFDMPVRVAKPREFGMTKPEFVISIGMLKHIDIQKGYWDSGNNIQNGRNKKGITKKIEGFFKGLF